MLFNYLIRFSWFRALYKLCVLLKKNPMDCWFAIIDEFIFEPHTFNHRFQNEVQFQNDLQKFFRNQDNEE